jgi:hypothetical protein
MQSNYRKATVLAMVLAVQFAFTGAAQGWVPWSNPNGTASFFDWQNGGSDNGLFGSPLLIGGDTFTFFPRGFRADSSNGVADSVGDRLEVDLIAHAGHVLSDVAITEYGDYGILDEGSVSVTGTLFLTNLLNAQVRWDNLVSTPPSPITSGQGNWTAHAAVDLSAEYPEWTYLKLVLDNNLLAISGPNDTVFIQKKIVGAAVAVSIIPEPATLGLLALGGLALLRRKPV